MASHGSRIAVSTSVLAAMAVSALACPLDDERHPRLPWWTRDVGTLPVLHESKPSPRPAPILALAASTDGGDALVRAIAREGDVLAMCGTGRGELIVRRARGVSTVQVRGFAPPIATCLTAAVEHASMFRLADGTIAQISIELR